MKHKIVLVPFPFDDLPEHLRAQLKTELSNTTNENPIENAKENLAAVIRSMRANPMFEEIEHPVTWQRQQRNEWE